MKYDRVIAELSLVRSLNSFFPSPQLLLTGRRGIGNPAQKLFSLSKSDACPMRATHLSKIHAYEMYYMRAARLSKMYICEMYAL